MRTKIHFDDLTVHLFVANLPPNYLTLLLRTKSKVFFSYLDTFTMALSLHFNVQMEDDAQEEVDDYRKCDHGWWRPNSE